MQSSLESWYNKDVLQEQLLFCMHLCSSRLKLVHSTKCYAEKCDTLDLNYVIVNKSNGSLED
jgi:hypothetical protein